MAKSMPFDSQIILNMLKIQDSINKILDEHLEEDILKDKSLVDLLTFYIIKMFALRKRFSGKTKKALTFFDDRNGTIIINSLNYCYPMISDTEIVNMATDMASGAAYEELKLRYENCVKDATKDSE